MGGVKNIWHDTCHIITVAIMTWHSKKSTWQMLAFSDDIVHLGFNLMIVSFCRCKRIPLVVVLDWSHTLILSSQSVTLDWWVFSYDISKTSCYRSHARCQTIDLKILISTRIRTTTPWRSCWRWTWRGPLRCCYTAARRWLWGRPPSYPAACGAARDCWESAFASAALTEPMRMFGMFWWVCRSGGLFFSFSNDPILSMVCCPGGGAKLSCSSGWFEGSRWLHHRSRLHHEWGTCLSDW